MYRLLKTDGRAKRGELQTVHGTIQTPVFMNVGTVAAIKGAVSTMDLWAGINRFLPIPVDFRCFPLQVLERLKKKA